ncbi:MAG: metal ABC transporter ATP-binding protein, partial [Gammaproteobacteria bacterium]
MTHSSETLVQAAGIYVERGGLVILMDIDVAIEAGEIVTLVGLNGSGKTTLVRVLAGLLRPDRGTVHRRPGLKIGYCPQRTHPDQNLPMTASDFLNLVKPAEGMTASDALKEVGIDGLAHRQLIQLSGGEYQRLMLARAIMRDPDLLILDEPFAGVDIAGQGDLYELIPIIRDRHQCGVILVSHDIHVVMASTDRVICLNHHVCCSGQPETVAK